MNDSKPGDVAPCYLTPQQMQTLQYLQSNQATLNVAQQNHLHMLRQQYYAQQQHQLQRQQVSFQVCSDRVGTTLIILLVIRVMVSNRPGKISLTCTDSTSLLISMQVSRLLLPVSWRRRTSDPVLSPSLSCSLLCDNSVWCFLLLSRLVCKWTLRRVLWISSRPRPLKVGRLAEPACYPIQLTVFSIVDGFFRCSYS